jgi:hypothetical protein
MGLGKLEKATYVSIKDGRLITKSAGGEDQSHDYLEGRLIDLKRKEKEFGGEKVTQYHFEFKDDEGELYILSTGERGGVARSLINSLASMQGREGVLRVVAYAKDGYSKVRLYQNGEPLDWKCKKIPAVEEKTLGGQKIKDETKRIEFFRNMAEEIALKVSRVN